MNNRLLRLVCLACGVLGSTAALEARASLMTVNVPFEFQAGGKVMPPGRYTFEAPEMAGVMFIHGQGATVTVLTNPMALGGTPSAAKLIFERRGGDSILTGIESLGYDVQLLSHSAKRTTTAAIPLP